MAFVPFTNVCKIEYVYTWDSQYCENVLHYQAPNALDEGLLEDAAAAALANWSASYKNQCSLALNLVKIKATDLTSESSAAIESSAGMPVVGTIDSPAVPNNVSVVIKFTTHLRGRSYRGRLYFCGLVAVGVLNSHLQPATLAAIENVGESLMSLTVNAQTWPLVIASRFHNKVERAAGVATEVIGAFVDPTVDSQRRRLPGRGR